VSAVGREGHACPAKDTASIKLASAAKGTVNAKPEALEPWGGHGCDMAPRQHAKEGECPLEALSRDDTARCKRKYALPTRRGAAEGMAGHGFRRALDIRVLLGSSSGTALRDCSGPRA
jgi:hypothetical protein